MTPIHLYPSKKKIAKITLLFLFSAVVFGVHIIETLLGHKEITSYFALELLLTLISIIFSIFYLRIFAHRKPAVTIDDNGIGDYFNLNHVGFIPWSNVAKISQVERNYGFAIVIELYDTDKQIESLKGFRKKYVRFVDKFLTVRAEIPTSCFDESHELILSIIEERFRQSRSHSCLEE